MAEETFRWSWRGWARSSEGYAVRLRGKTNLQYTDECGDIHISAEVMSQPAIEIVVYTSTIPDRAGRPREEVVSRLHRAFDYMGWTMVIEGG